METFKSICSNFYVVSAFRLLVGFLLAGIIGAERESLNKPAGFKTHALIGISGVLVVILSEYWYKYAPYFDTARIPAQILSGIGFIGAGTILRDGFSVKGLTTASSLLAVTCIGLAIGAGFYLGGIIATLIVYIILHRSNFFSPSVEHYFNTEVHLKVEDYANTIIVIQNILDKYNINIKKIKNNQKDEDHSKDVLLVFRYHKDTNINSVLQKFLL